MAANFDGELEKSWKMWLPLVFNLVMSVLTYITTVRLIPKVEKTFIKANLFGIDMSKRTSVKV